MSDDENWTIQDWINASQKRMDAINSNYRVLSYNNGIVRVGSQIDYETSEWFHGYGSAGLSEEDCRNVIMQLTARKLQVNETKPSIWLRLIDGWKQGRTLPTDSATRREIPVYSGAIAYFPAALACVAACSARGTAEHQLGALYHDRTKTETSGHLDCEIRHLIDRGDEPDELVHAASKAWRALADLQLLCERLGAPLAPGAKKPQ